MSQASAFVMPIDLNNRVPAHPFDLSSGSEANFLDSADSWPLTASSFRGVKFWHHWLDLPKDDDSLLRKLFSRGALVFPKWSPTCTLGPVLGRHPLCYLARQHLPAPVFSCLRGFSSRCQQRSRCSTPCSQADRCFIFGPEHPTHSLPP